MTRKILCTLPLIFAIILVILKYAEGNHTQIVWQVVHRSKRGTMTPCLRCTILNKEECCQKYGRCCQNEQRTAAVIVNNRVKPATVPQFAQQTGNKNILSSCPLRNRNVLSQAKCGSYCGQNSQCASASRCCPRSSISSQMCCRPLDIRGNCPGSTCSNCCRRCSSAADCPAGEGCCPATAVRGCCARGCGSSNSFSNIGGSVNGGNVFYSTVNTRTISVNPEDDLDTVRIPITETLPPLTGSARTIVITETLIRGNSETVTVTMTETVWKNDGHQGGVHVTEDGGGHTGGQMEGHIGGHTVTVTEYVGNVMHTVTVTPHGGHNADHTVVVTKYEGGHDEHVITVTQDGSHDENVVTITQHEGPDEHVVTVTQNGGPNEHVMTVTHHGGHDEHVVTEYVDHVHEVTVTEQRTIYETKYIDGPPVIIEETVEVIDTNNIITVTDTKGEQIVYTTVDNQSIGKEGR